MFQKIVKITSLLSLFVTVSVQKSLYAQSVTALSSANTVSSYPDDKLFPVFLAYACKYYVISEQTAINAYKNGSLVFLKYDPKRHELEMLYYGAPITVILELPF